MEEELGDAFRILSAPQGLLQQSETNESPFLQAWDWHRQGLWLEFPTEDSGVSPSLDLV